MQRLFSSIFFAAALFAASARADSYVPHLPKTTPATSIVVVDLAKDKSSHDWRAVEALVAAQVIQGIVNRDSAEKIYFVNNKRRWNGEWNPWPMDEFALKDGLIPVRQTRAALDEKKEFPALSYLLRHYAKKLKGKIRMPSLGDKDERFAGPDGGVMAALTAAGQLDALVVSPHIDAYLEGEGIALPLLEDTTRLTDHLAAFEWAYAKYFRPATTRQLIGKLSLNNFGNFPPRFAPTTIDYFIASRAFILDLNANSPAESAAMTRLLNPDNYPSGTPVLGDIDWEVTELDRISELGYFFNFMVDGPNYSVTSSFPSMPDRISTPTFAKSAPLDPCGVYVAFYVTDGDNLSFSYYVHRSAWRTSPTAGQVPIGWSYNPLLFDLFPTQLEWLSKNNYSHAFELVSNFNNGRPYLPSSAPAAAGFARFVSLLRNYLDHTNGIFTSINNLGDQDTASRLYRELTTPLFAFSGYAGRDPKAPPTWQVLPSGAPSTGLIGATQREATPDAIAGQIQSLAASATPERPLFLLAAAGDSGHSGDSVQLVADIKSRLTATAGDRHYYFLRPVDLAETWLASAGLENSETFEAENLPHQGLAVVPQRNASGGLATSAPLMRSETLQFSVRRESHIVEVRYTNPSPRIVQCGVYADGQRLATMRFLTTPDADTYARLTIPTLNIRRDATLSLLCDESDAAANTGAGPALLDQLRVAP